MKAKDNEMEKLEIKIKLENYCYNCGNELETDNIELSNNSLLPSETYLSIRTKLCDSCTQHNEENIREDSLTEILNIIKDIEIDSKTIELIKYEIENNFIC